MSDPDDEALSWAGDEPVGERTGKAGGRGIRGERGSAVQAARPTSETPEADATVARQVGGSFALLGYGMLAGVYALLTVGWFLAVSQNVVTASSIVGQRLYELGEGLAIASPAIWFAVVIILTRGTRTAVRLLWLVIGMMLLVPWPYLMAGGAS